MPKEQVHEFRKIENDLKADIFDDVRVVLLYGAEVFLSDSYEKRLRDKYIEEEYQSINYSRFDGEELSADDIIATCDTLPFISEKKVVTIAHIPGNDRNPAKDEMNKLAAYLPDIPPTTLLIITSDSEKFAKSLDLWKAINSCGKHYCFYRFEKSDAVTFINSRLHRSGLKCGEGVIDAILGVTEYLDKNSDSGLFDLDNDLRLLCSYADGKDSLSLADVASCLGTSAETNVFALLDSVSLGKKGEAIELVRNICDKEKSTFGLLALLTGQFELMLSYRELKERGKSFRDIVNILEIKSEWRLKKAAGFADLYTSKNLIELLDRLYRVDMDIKEGLYSEELALTMFIAELKK